MIPSEGNGCITMGFERESRERRGRSSALQMFYDRDTFESLASKMQMPGRGKVEAAGSEERQEDVAMLDAFIIDEMRRREREEAERRIEIERPMLEIPVPEIPLQRPREEEDEAPQRGVIVIDL